MVSRLHRSPRYYGLLHIETDPMVITPWHIWLLGIYDSKSGRLLLRTISLTHSHPRLFTHISTYIRCRPYPQSHCIHSMFWIVYCEVSTCTCTLSVCSRTLSVGDHGPGNQLHRRPHPHPRATTCQSLPVRAIEIIIDTHVNNWCSYLSYHCNK